ncbi:MAG TPA: hypothetical protein VHX36_13595, partial [Candidatus Acidoferrales bacterium]|nr:hypothetical protein [Candidatus Acidoferrales bacterium]
MRTNSATCPPKAGPPSAPNAAFAFAGLARRLLPSNHILSAGRAVRRATPLLRQTLRLHLQTGSSTTK